ncbi:MAG: ribosomal protein S18-alanine N-acetyltransferase [Magnetococcus sp. WYHC-3]
MMPVDFILEAMKPADLDAVVALHARCAPRPWFRASFSEELALHAWCRCARPKADPGQLAGFLVARAQWDTWHVLELAVDPPWRRRRAGTLLLAELEDHVRSIGGRALTLEVRASNAAGLALYQSLGYTRVGLRRDYYPPPPQREDAVVMTRLLTPVEDP